MRGFLLRAYDEQGAGNATKHSLGHGAKRDATKETFSVTAHYNEIDPN
jgi:hypothetical protein